MSEPAPWRRPLHEGPDSPYRDAGEVEPAPSYRTLTYEVTYTDGVETGRKLLSSTITTAPVQKIVAVGTKASQPTSCLRC